MEAASTPAPPTPPIRTATFTPFEKEERPLLVQIDFEKQSEDGDKKYETQLAIESLGPNTVIGMVADHVLGFYTQSPDGARVKEIRIKRMEDGLFS